MPLKFWSSDLNSESNCFLKSFKMFSRRMRSVGSKCSFAIVFFLMVKVGGDFGVEVQGWYELWKKKFEVWMVRCAYFLTT